MDIFERFKDLGIDEELAKKAEQIVNKEVPQHFVAKDQYNKKVLELDDTKKALQAAQTNSADNEIWAQKYNDEVTAHNTTKSTYAAEKDAVAVDSLVSELLSREHEGVGKMNPAAVSKAVKQYDRAMVERDKDGKIKNADKVLEHFKSEWSDFFMKIDGKGTDPATPPSGSAFAGKNIQELMAEANKNPDKLSEILAQVDTITRIDKTNKTDKKE